MRHSVFRTPPAGAQDRQTRLESSASARSLNAEPIPAFYKVCLQEYGYEVALASANCDKAKMKLILPNHIDDDIFTPAWFESPAFQHCEPYKTYELNRILEFFDTPAACAMFFDDLEYNVEKYARDVGVNWRLVDPEHGVTWDDFWAVVPQLKDRCDCKSA